MGGGLAWNEDLNFCFGSKADIVRDLTRRVLVYLVNSVSSLLLESIAMSADLSSNALSFIAKSTQQTAHSSVPNDDYSVETAQTPNITPVKQNPRAPD